jgi:tetratricopeptide (TPR) repeat protein
MFIKNMNKILKLFLLIIIIPNLIFSDDSKKKEIQEKTKKKLEIRKYAQESVVYLRQKNIKLAEKSFEKLTQIGLDTDEFYYIKGAIHYSKGEFELSEESLKKAIEKNPDHNASYYLLGMIYSEGEKWREAAENFQKAVDLSDYEPYYHYNLAVARLFLQELLPSANHAKIAIQLKANYTESKVLLARVLYRLGKKNESLDVIEKLLKDEPNNKEIRNIYSKILLEEKKVYAKVSENLSKYRDLTIEEKNILAESTYKLGDKKKAEPILKELVDSQWSNEENKIAYLKILLEDNRLKDAEYYSLLMDRQDPSQRGKYYSFFQDESMKRYSKQTMYHFFPYKN